MYVAKILMTTICVFSLGQLTILSIGSNPAQHHVSLQARGFYADSDGDGVADKDDKCPNTPAGVLVGPNGCPIDGEGGGTPGDLDGDGVPNQFDSCPNTPPGAIVDGFGCPIDGSGPVNPDDLDGDGVHNDYDECPGTLPGVIVHANGCPID